MQCSSAVVHNLNGSVNHEAEAGHYFVEIPEVRRRLEHPASQQVLRELDPFAAHTSICAANLPRLGYAKGVVLRLR